jgi:NADPH-dependent curcumin reductase CurA
VTGSDEKCVLCKKQYGYHDAINYKASFDECALRAVCPRGVDVFFDNTSGTIADTVVRLMNVRGRIIQCGTAAVPAWDPPPTAPRRDREILVKRLRHQGFVIFDYIPSFAAVADTLAKWVNEGSLFYREDIEEGLDRAPTALADIYQGVNLGKKIIRV